MSKFTKIFQQTFWQILGKVVTTLSTFIILGLVTRNYGKDGTGVFTLALTYLSMFYLVADFGFNAHVLRKVTGYRVQGTGYRVQKQWNKLLGTRLIWSGVLVVLAVGLLPFWPFSTPLFVKAVSFGSLAIIASSVFVTCNLIFQGKLRYDLSVLASALGTLAGLAVFVFLSAYKFSIPFLLLAHLISWTVIAAAALFLVRKFFQQIFPVFDLIYAKNLFKQSWPIAATLSLNVLYFRADAFMIAYFKSVSDVGIYNVAYSVFQSALVLPTFIMNAYYPLMLKTLHGLKWILLGLLGLSLLGTLITLIFSPFIIKILTGGGFAGSTESLQILSLGFPAYFLSSLLMWILIAKGKYKVMFLLYMSGLIFNLILNFIYIPQYSFLAASWTTVISEYFILALQVMVLWLKRK
ncbi:flippase [Candidatus Daviesbacteria bacterium]|nr:flippase [Candidatus Daviesbacteria bacterium]